MYLLGKPQKKSSSTNCRAIKRVVGVKSWPLSLRKKELFLETKKVPMAIKLVQGGWMVRV